MYRLYDTELNKFVIIDNWHIFTDVEPFLYTTFEEAVEGLKESWKKHDKRYPDNSHDRARYIIKEIENE